jgi:protein phosphatase
MFGGRDTNTPYNDLWKYSLQTKTWVNIPTVGTKPTARAYHSLFFDDPYLFLFGGLTATGKPLNEFHMLDTKYFEWKKIFQLEAPAPRHFHAICNGEFEKNKFMYGGLAKNLKTGDSEVLEDLWLIDYNS